MRLLTVNVVEELIPGPKRTGLTAIDKRPQSGAVRVGELGLENDRVCDTKHHGGPDQALYAYAEEDARWWAADLGRDIPAGLFGENLRTEGLDITGALIGEVWRIGSEVEVMVRTPRTPCVTFSHRMEIPGWIKRFRHEGRPGAYLKVLKTGTVTAGDPIEIIHRPDHDTTIGDIFGNADPAKYRRLLAGGTDLVPELRRRLEAAASRG